jgi:hypothetical protein
MAGMMPLAAPTKSVTANPTRTACPGKKKKGKSPRVGSPPSVKSLARPSPRQPPISAITNDSGLFVFPQLPLGEYTLNITAPGFKQAVQEHVVLHVGDHVRQDVDLTLGEQNQTVTVEGSAGLLQLQSAEIKDVIQNQQVIDLPLKGREFLELTLLSEGVVSPPGGTRGDALQQTGKLINVMGNRTGHNLFLVDGSSFVTSGSPVSASKCMPP